jgi:hypothetical protein
VGDEEGTKTVEERLLDTLLANTAALTTLHASITNHDREYVEGRKAAREQANSLNAKVENLDRSIGEMRLATQNGEAARQAELKHIYDLLTEERKDRREAVSDGREGEREVQQDQATMLREMIKEELGERRETRKENRQLMKTAGQEIWKAGGKYIVAGVVAVILAVVMKLTGTSLADIIGMTGK